MLFIYLYIKIYSFNVLCICNICIFISLRKSLTLREIVCSGNRFKILGLFFRFSSIDGT